MPGASARALRYREPQRPRAKPMHKPLLSLLFMMACASARPSPWVSPPPLATLAPEVMPPRGLLLLGEVHGTKEIPRRVGEIVAAACRAGPVVLALELPPGRTPSLQAFLRGAGGAAARRQLVADPWWRDPFQDGRRSAAMVDLLETVRALRAGGCHVSVVPIDTDDVHASAEDRESTLTANALAARRGHPDAAMIVYAGNLHTGRAPAPLLPAFQWMATRLARAGLRFVTLDARWEEGTLWACRGATVELCKVWFLSAARPTGGVPGRASPPRAPFALEPSGDGFDGWYAVGSLSASPPAVARYGADEAAGASAEAALAREIAAVLTSAAAWRERARRAYREGDFDRCAALFSRIAMPHGNDAYDHACCLARAGRTDEALARLRYALAHGFTNLAHAESDPDLASLRYHPRWPLTAQRP